jgi:hypothetical protein
MSEKSILEQALLQVENLEKAVKANAKGILASTMKQELNELLKESMEEEEAKEEEAPEEEKDMTADESSKEQQDDEAENEDINDEDDEASKDIDSKDKSEDDDDDMSDEDDDDMEDADMGHEDMDEPEMDHMGHDEPEADHDDVLDMTNSSHDEVLKVFKAMKPEDGIIVKKDGNKIELNTDDDEFIIKLDEEEKEDMEEDFNVNDDDVHMSEEELSEHAEDGDPYYKSIGKKSGKEAKEPKFHGPKKYDVYTKPVKKQMGEEEEEMKEHAEDGDPYYKSIEKKSGKEAKEPKFHGPKKDDVYTKPVKGQHNENAEQEDESDEQEDETIYEIELDGPEEMEGQHDESSRTIGNGYHGGLESKKKYYAGNKRDEINESELKNQIEKLKSQNGEYKKALVLFKEKLDEVAVFNANLAYAVRLITENSTTKQEKLNIMKRFDSISTLNEAKNLFKTIQSELDNRKPISESMIEKISSTPSSSSTEVLSESKAYENPQFKRMKDLMKKIK